MTLPLDDLALLDAPAAGVSTDSADSTAAGAPLQIPLDLIDEDPDQPRTEFDETALRELAETIALRGVRQPISVRPHPREAGRWMLNFGARRLRASRLAGRDCIPAFVDATADSFDQVIENEQRQSLTPMELALFVQRQQQAGAKLADIAQRLGKSRTYLSFVAALIDPPAWLLQVYRSGACRGLSELYELRRLGQQAPELTQQWLGGRQSVTRADIQRFKAHIDGLLAPVKLGEGRRPSERSGSVEPVGDEPSSSPQAMTSAKAAQRSSDPVPPVREIETAVELRGTWQGQSVRVLFDSTLTADGRIRVQRSADHGVQFVPVTQITELVLVVTGA